MATHSGFLPSSRLGPLSRLARTLRAVLPVLLAVALATPAQARRKKRTPPPPAPEPAAPVTPAPAPAPTAAPAPAAAAPAAAPTPSLRTAVPDVPSGPPMLVVGLGLDAAGEREAAQAAYWAERTVRQSHRQAPISLVDALDPVGAAAREKAGSEGQQLLEKARKAYNDLDLDGAAALCDQAYRAFLQSDLPAHFAGLIDASELKIAAYAADPAKADRARAELNLLLPIDPRGALSPNLFNPDTIRFAESLRTQLRRDASLTLEIRTGGVPARIFVDGTFRGISPVTVRGLLPGNHFVTAVAPGYQRAQRKVNPGPEPVAELPLTRIEGSAAQAQQLAALRSGFRSSQLPKLAAALGASAKADQVLVLGAGPGPQPGTRQLAAARVLVARAALVEDLDRALPSDASQVPDAVDGLVTEAISQDGLLRGHREPAAVASAGGGGMRYAGYGLIGGGVVAAGVGTFFGLSARSEQNKFKSLPQTDPTASSVSSSGKRDSLIANVAFGTAVVAVGTGVVLAILGSRDAVAEGEVAPVPTPEPSRTEVKHTEVKRTEPARTTPTPERKPAPVAAPAEVKHTAPVPTPAPAPVPERKPAAAPASPTPAPVAKTPTPAPSSHPEPSAPVGATPAPSAPARSAAPAASAPDAGSDVDAKKPPKDLGEDIKE